MSDREEMISFMEEDLIKRGILLDPLAGLSPEARQLLADTMAKAFDPNQPRCLDNLKPGDIINIR